MTKLSNFPILNPQISCCGFYSFISSSFLSETFTLDSYYFRFTVSLGHWAFPTTSSLFNSANIIHLLSFRIDSASCIIPFSCNRWVICLIVLRIGIPSMNSWSKAIKGVSMGMRNCALLDMTCLIYLDSFISFIHIKSRNSCGIEQLLI